MKKAAKIVIFVLILAVVFTIVPATLFAHPIPVPEQSVGNVPAVAKVGLHKACGNVNPFVQHIFLYFLAGGPH